MNYFSILPQKFMRLFSVLFLCFFTTILSAQVTYNIGSGSLIIPGNSTSDYVITGTTTTNTVIIQTGYHGTVTLRNLNMTSTIAPGVRDGRSGVSCITVEGAYNCSNMAPVTKVDFILEGTNRLIYAGDWYCALQVNQGAQIKINAIDPNNNASGTLLAECTTAADGSSGSGAAIGAPNFPSGTTTGPAYCQGSTTIQGSGSYANSLGKTAGGNIIISSGKVTAAGSHGAGLGGGWYTWYDGVILVTGGEVYATSKRHSAGLGSGCPHGSGVITSNHAPNSAIIVLPPAYIEATGRISHTDPPNPDLALAGAKNITYINDPAKPIITVRTEDYESNATIYLDLTETPGIRSIFDVIYPEFSLSRTAIGRTNTAGTHQFHARFEQLTTFFTDASSTKPGTEGRPYLPVTTTMLSGGTVVLPLLGAGIAFTDYWSTPLWVNYTTADAWDHAHRIKVEYNDPDPITNVTYRIQDGIHFSTLKFLAADGVTEIPMPTTIRNGDVFYIVIPVNQGKPLGYYSDVLLINGRYQGIVIPGYIRRIGRQRVAYDDSQSNNHIKVTASPQSFTAPYPTTNTVTLTLNIDHSGMNNTPYEEFNIIARYLVTMQPNYDLAVAATPLVTWPRLNVAPTSGANAITTVSFSGMSPGTYYIHWYAESGVAYAHSLNVTAPPRTYGGFGQYTVGDPVTVGTISGPSVICGGQTAALTGTASTGGTGSYTYTWQSASSSTGPWTNLSSSNSQNYTTGALTATTFFRRQTTDGGTNYYSNVIQVSFYPSFSAGAITSGSSSICSGNPEGIVIDNNTLASGGDNSITYQWKKSIDSDTAQVISGATGATYTVPASDVDRTNTGASNKVIVYTREARDGACQTPFALSTGSYTLTVRPAFSAESISGADTICSSATTAITTTGKAAAGGDGNITYQWKKSIDGGTAQVISGATGATYTIPASDADRTNTGTFNKVIVYTREVRDGTCQPSFVASTGNYTLTVYPSFKPGAIRAGSTVVCSDDEISQTIGNATVAAGGNGAITYQWYRDGVAIPGANAESYSFQTSDKRSVQTSTTVTYIRKAKDTTCQTADFANSEGEYKLTVNPFSTLDKKLFNHAHSDTVCSGGVIELVTSAPGVINPVFKWYASTSPLANPIAEDTIPKYTPQPESLIVTPDQGMMTFPFYVSVSGDNFCEGVGSAGRDTIFLMVRPYFESSLLSTKDSTICSGGSAELKVEIISSFKNKVDNPVYKWYASTTATTPVATGETYFLSETDLSTNGASASFPYFVAIGGTNFCENRPADRSPATVYVKAISGPKDITIKGNTGVCGGEGATIEASAPSVQNSVFKWYSNPTGGTPFYTGSEYKTSALKADTTFYLSVSGSNYCEGSVRDTVEVSIECFTVHGTVFPLVFFNDEAIDTLFTIEAKLYVPPTPGSGDPVAYFRRVRPLHEATAVHYNGSVHVPGTPRNPGYSSSLVNPGYPINWKIINKQPEPGAEKDTTALLPGEAAASSVGHYTFENVSPGDYILTLSRPGYITRYAKVTVGSGITPFIKHRELIGGDVNGDMVIDPLDAIAISYRIGYVFTDKAYDARYDINGNTEIETGDLSLVKFFQGFHYEGYEDTSEWLNEYYQ